MCLYRLVPVSSVLNSLRSIQFLFCEIIKDTVTLDVILLMHALTNSLSFSLVIYLRMRSTYGPDGVSCFHTRLVYVVCQ